MWLIIIQPLKTKQKHQHKSLLISTTEQYLVIFKLTCLEMKMKSVGENVTRVLRLD